MPQEAPTKQTLTWNELIKMAKAREREIEALPFKEQRRLFREARMSWVYGNCKLSNPDVTRKMVEEAYDKAYPDE